MVQSNRLSNPLELARPGLHLWLRRLQHKVPCPAPEGRTSTTLHRSIKPLKRDAALVAPRSFPFVSISGAEAGSQPFSFEWDVDHPSSYAYAGTHGGMRGALKGLSYALTLVSRRIISCPVSIRSARICSSVVHAHGLAGPSVGRKGSARRLATGGPKEIFLPKKGPCE